ncbi:MAG: polysaccharide pyruvyl transferase family protein [Lawsonibacter sp.]
MEKHLDPGAGQLAARGLTIPHYFLDDAGGAGTIIGALSRMQAVVSMRLHALIFAAGQGIPWRALSTTPRSPPSCGISDRSSSWIWQS